MPTGFDPAVWAGEKHLTTPARTPITIGSVVWEKLADGAEHDARGGVVVKVVHNSDGEMVVTVLRARQQAGRFSVYTTELDASDLNTADVQPADKARLHQAARSVFRHLGERPTAYITGHSRWLMEMAVGLVLTADDLEAAQ